MSTAIRVELPTSLSVLAGTAREITVPVDGPATQSALLDAIEAAHPALRGTIRDHLSRRRRPFIRFFACRQDVSHAAPDDSLPPDVVEGKETFLIFGALAGG